MRIATVTKVLLVSLAVQAATPALAWFSSGQAADLLLGGIGLDFNTTGGALLFNHPGNLATDGTRLVMTDRANNRVLVWNSLPAANTGPDLVLGQPGFTTNDPGTGLNQMNWPVGVATANGKLVVADTENDRLLIWSTFPTTNGQAADLLIQFTTDPTNPKRRLEWPWAVWTDGTKLIATHTMGSSSVLIWNTFPTTNSPTADLILRGRNRSDGTDRFGTARTIGTDGRSYLIVGDHNPKNEANRFGSFVWNSLPTADDTPYDYFLTTGAVNWGGVTAPDGRFIQVENHQLMIWNSVPTSSRQADLVVGKNGPGYAATPCGSDGYNYQGGDGSGVVLTSSGKLFVSLYNGNKIAVLNQVPTSSQACPDYVIGAPDLATNTLMTNYIITNAMPATNGTSLLATSDFDARLYVWPTIPTVSGTAPAYVRELDFSPWDNELYGNTLVAGGKGNVEIWSSLPTGGQAPDVSFKGGIGSVTFLDVMGVALDSRYLYVSDGTKIYIWDALPAASSAPRFTLDRGAAVGRLSSDGTYLVAMSGSPTKVEIYLVSQLGDAAQPIASLPPAGAGYSLNVPMNVLATAGHLFMADTGNGRVLGWQDITQAIAGATPDVVIGKSSLAETGQAATRESLFFPAGLALFGDRLWVGEFKFSYRLLGFKDSGGTTVPIGGELGSGAGLIWTGAVGLGLRGRVRATRRVGRHAIAAY